MDSSAVRTLRRDEVQPASDVLARALHEDPFFRAIEPEATKRRAVLHRQMAGAIRYSLRNGLVEVTPNLSGVAVWLPPGQTRVTLRTMLAAGPVTVWEMMSLSPAAMRRAMPFRKPMEDLHHRSASGPHWYLWILGIDPRHQRQGLGTTLMQHRLSEIGRQPVYLETARRTNITYYERFGFEAAGIAKIPEMGVTFWGMLCPTRERAPTG